MAYGIIVSDQGCENNPTHPPGTVRFSEAASIFFKFLRIPDRTYESLLRPHLVLSSSSEVHASNL